MRLLCGTPGCARLLKKAKRFLEHRSYNLTRKHKFKAYFPSEWMTAADLVELDEKNAGEGAVDDSE